MSRTTSDNPGLHFPSAKGVYLFFAIAAIFILTALLYSFSSGNRMVAFYTPLIDATMEIKLEATTAHLWVEEIIGGDLHEEERSIWKHLDNAAWYGNAMLSGGKNPEGKFIPLKSPELRTEIAAALENLKTFRQITQERLSSRVVHKIGSALDQQYDKVFKDFLNRVDQVETNLQSKITSDLARYRSIQVFLVVISLLLFVAVGVIFFIHELQLVRNVRTIDAANSELIAKEKDLRESEQKYRALIETTDTGYVIVDGQGYVLDANDEYVRVAGCQSFEEIRGKNVAEWTAPYHREHNRQEVEKCLKTGSISNLDIDYLTQDGTIIPVEINAAVIDQESSPIILAMIRDITGRKDAERNLASEKEHLAVTLRSIGDGVITSDTNGNVVLLNKVAEQLTGWSQEEAIGRPVTEIFHIINEKTGTVCESPVEKVLELGKIIGLANHTALIAKDGKQRSIADSGAPIRDMESNIIGVVLVFRDVTDQLKMEEELLKIKKLESVGVLAGGIAHDFNNILAAILGNINLAAQFVGPGNKAASLLLEAEKATLRAEKLTKQLLTFSKGGEPVRETASISQLIRESAEFILHGSKVVCNFDIPDDLWMVDIDTGQISQVIQNLILNASHAMPEGGKIGVCCANISDITAETMLSLHRGDYVKITIQDNGIGIPENIIEKIFDPYFTTKHEGSGLGLAVTHSIINKHDGHISVKSEPGHGTTFTIYLPASSREQHVAADEKISQIASGKGRVLIMDDDKMVGEVAEYMLTHLGYEVELCVDGVETVNRYKELQEGGKVVDLIIMDLTIPGGMGGKEAVQEILAIDPEAKVIVASGYSTDPILANCREYGFQAAVTKPFDLAELSKAVSSALT
jgi:PAS domain S-box-containing protein